MPKTAAVQLVPFDPCGPARRFSVGAVIERRGDRLRLAYRLEGPVRQLVIPPPAAHPGFTPDLWEETCFECFLQHPPGPAYAEWNFAPAGNWWFCDFAGYRSPAPDQPAGLKPRSFHIRTEAAGLFCTVEIPCPGGLPLQAGPAMVLAHAGGGRSHWAANHPAGRPDFHHARTFACRL